MACVSSNDTEDDDDEEEEEEEEECDILLGIRITEEPINPCCLSTFDAFPYGSA